MIYAWLAIAWVLVIICLVIAYVAIWRTNAPAPGKKNHKQE